MTDPVSRTGTQTQVWWIVKAVFFSVFRSPALSGPLRLISVPRLLISTCGPSLPWREPEPPHVSAGAERGGEAAPQRACRAARPSVTTQSPGVKAKPPKGSINCSNQQLKNINRCFSHLGESQQRIWMSLQSRAGTLWYVCEALLLVGEPHAGLSNTVLARAPRGLYLGALESSRPSMPCSKRQRPIHSH